MIVDMGMTVSGLDIPELISIVIVNYNGERFIKACLDSVLKTDYLNYEIIVVDNNSTDKSAEILESFKSNPKVKILFSKKNLQYAGGNNLGFKNSKGTYAVFLNFDTTVDPNWLTELKKTFDSSSNISAAQCLLLLSDKKTFDSLGGTIDYCIKLVPAPYLWGINDKAAKKYQLFYGCGAALAVRRTVLEKTGLFDPNMPTDEVDLCWRINLQGGIIVLTPKSVVYHFRGGAFGRDINKQRIFFAELCALSAIIKNFSTKNVFLSLYYCSFFSLLSIFTDTLIRHRVDLTAYRFKAYIQVLRSMPALFSKRAQVQTFVRAVSDTEIEKNIMRPNLTYFIWGNLFDKHAKRDN